MSSLPAMRRFTFGGRMPAVVGVLIALTFGASIAGRVTGLVEYGALIPAAVLHGQAWRLVTWVFFELDPMGLLFGCLMLYWFGRDLSWAWGARRFIATYLAFAVVVGAAVCGLALLFPPLVAFPFVGVWPLAEALTIAWATLYPDRQINMYFVFPIAGRNLVYLTVGLTALFAVFSGFAQFLPHFLAEALMLLYLGGLRRLWQRLRVRVHDRSRRRHLHVVTGERPGGPKQPPRWMN